MCSIVSPQSCYAAGAQAGSSSDAPVETLRSEKCHRWLVQVVTPFSMLSGCAQGIISIFWWAVIDMQAGETYSQVRR